MYVGMSERAGLYDLLDLGIPILKDAQFSFACSSALLHIRISYMQRLCISSVYSYLLVSVYLSHVTVSFQLNASFFAGHRLLVICSVPLCIHGSSLFRYRSHM